MTLAGIQCLLTGLLKKLGGGQNLGKKKTEPAASDSCCSYPTIAGSTTGTQPGVTRPLDYNRF